MAPRASGSKTWPTYQGVEEDMNVIRQLEKEQQKEKVPALRVGGGGLRQNFTVRRVTHGVGVERTFMIHSPRIDRIDVLRHGDVRQGRLYYLRGKVGKAARIRERRSLIREAEAETEAEGPDGGEEESEE